MNFASVKALTIPEGKVKLITRKSDGVVLWKGGYKNWFNFSTEADGVTIYNNGLGHKDKTRIRSGGAEANNDYAVCSGFIPLKQGDTIRILPPFDGSNTENAINFYDAEFANLGQVTDSGALYGICRNNYKTQVVNGASTLTLTTAHDANIRYVRITHRNNNADIVITVNEEIA